MEYIRLAEGLTKYKLIPETEDIWNHIASNEKDYYVSLYKYNDEHYKQWKEKRTVAGIKDVYTNKLFFDLDHAIDPEVARQDGITIVSRLLSKGIKQDNIQVAFSGNKGYSIEVDSTSKFTPEEFKNITAAIAGDLKTFDTVVSDPQRIVRVVGTKHNKSGLYKFPLTVNQLADLTTKQIQELASNVDNINPDIMDSWVEIELPTSIVELRFAKEKEKKSVEVEVHDLDLSKKPKWLPEAKYALQEGYFGAGERNTAFMVLASTYKNQGFSKEIVYRMLKGVAEVQASRNNVERYSDKELWKNIVDVVFKPDWKGGIYSYDNTPLLQEVTKRLGLKVPKEESVIIPLSDVSSVFRKFATDIDNNTIKLGIPAIDKDVRITTSMLVGLVSPPGGGKTTTAFEILNNASNSKIQSMFFSMDMGAPLVFQRLIQKHTGLFSKKIFEMYQTNDPKLKTIEDNLSEQYKNVSFCFKSGLTVEEIREHIIQQQQTSDEKIKLVVIDYLECISSGFSDATASGAYITQKLKDIANELELTVLLLLQPPKVAGDPSDEINSYTKIKGSSVIQQACSVIFSMWRPGFSPKTPHEDRFVCFSVLKNRMGGLAQYQFAWDGLTGSISELDEMELDELKKIIARKATEKLDNM